MLLDPLEEQFDLPVAKPLSNGARRQDADLVADDARRLVDKMGIASPKPLGFISMDSRSFSYRACHTATALCKAAHNLIR